MAPYILKIKMSIFSVISILFFDGINLGSASAMEQQNVGRRTFNNTLDGDSYIDRNKNDFRLFVVTDGQNYSVHRTDRGEMLTIQEVPGFGRCGDYALGISRKELLEKIEIALKDNDEDVISYNNELRNRGESFESILKSDAFLDDGMMVLAAKLFKFNIEFYVPNLNSLGKSIKKKSEFGSQYDQEFKTITELTLSKHIKQLKDFPNAPVIRIYHGGNKFELGDFKATNTQHFRYLYINDNNMQPWEVDKVRLLEIASAEYSRKNSAGYEGAMDEVFRIQKAGLEGAGKMASKPVEKRVGPSREQLERERMEQIELVSDLLVEKLRERVSMGGLDSYLRESGIESSLWGPAKELAKNKYEAEQKPKVTSKDTPKKVGPSSDQLERERRERIDLVSDMLVEKLRERVSMGGLDSYLRESGIEFSLWGPAKELAKNKYEAEQKPKATPKVTPKVVPQKTIAERARDLGITVATLEQYEREARANNMSVDDYLKYMREIGMM